MKEAFKNFMLILCVIVIICSSIFICGCFVYYFNFNLEKDVQIKEVEVVKEVKIEKSLNEYFDDYYISPLDGPVWITSPVGPRTLKITDDAFHRGDDLVSNNKNAKVKAAADGVVVEHWPAPNGYYKGHPIYGGYIIIKHNNSTYTVYAHMKQTKVRLGQTVKQGEIIGIIGNTGVVTGTHLHFEIIVAPHTFLNLENN